MTFFTELTNLLLNGVGSNLFYQSGKLISGIAPIFQIGFGIYILLVAFNYYNKGVDGSIIDLSKNAAGWLIVIACAFNASQYAKIAEFAWQLPETLSGILTDTPFDINTLDKIFTKFMGSITKINLAGDKLDWWLVSDKLAVAGAAIIMIICFCVMFAVITAFYLVAKLSLAMVIVIGPFFIGSMLFPPTRQWGMNWVGQVLNYSITITFFTIIAAFALNFYESHVEQSLTGILAQNGVGYASVLMTAIPSFFLSTIIFIVVIWNVPAISSALTGGAGANGFSRTLANVARMSKGMPPLPPGGGGGKSGGSIGKG